MVDMLSRESVVGLEVVTLTWEVSSSEMLMVLGGEVSRMMGKLMVGWQMVLVSALSEAVRVLGR